MGLYFDSGLAKRIYGECFESVEREFLNAFLRSGDVFVDVGANTGLFALIAAHRVGPTGRVYAFEPCLATYQRLVDNVQANGFANVRCHRLALSDRNGVARMNVSIEGFDGQNSLAPPTVGGTFSVETVTCTTWDSFVEENDLAGRVAMMKIDVEGWESRVMHGARSVLSRADAPVLQVEFFDRASRSAGSSCDEVYHLLEELGYQLYLYDAESNEIVSEPLRATYHSPVNLFAAKHGDQVQARLESRSRMAWLQPARG
jgi:FkbM family methyltransferase